MVLPVRMRIHWGSGRFCFCFFPKIFLTLKVLLDGCVEKETRIRRQSKVFFEITLSNRAAELLGSAPMPTHARAHPTPTTSIALGDANHTNAR